MNYSVNQVRQLYVANTYDASVNNKSDMGTIAVGVDNDKTHLYLKYRGAENLMRSDLIDTDKMLAGKATKADDLAYKLKTATVELNPAVNEGTPIPGQDYVLRIEFTHYIGMSDEDTYYKYGAVHAYTGMSTGDFWQAMAVSLFKNFSREAYPLLTFSLGGVVVAGTRTSDNKTVPVDEDGNVISGSDSIVITEYPQDWRRGVKQQTPVIFRVVPTTVWYDADTSIWGLVTPGEGDTVGNGRKTADLEFFCMGERGDQYRGINWPNNIPTHYLVDPDQTYNYLDLHYCYVGGNEGVQKSEKTITIVSPSASVINSIISAVNSAVKEKSGIEIATI